MPLRSAYPKALHLPHHFPGANVAVRQPKVQQGGGQTEERSSRPALSPAGDDGKRRRPLSIAERAASSRTIAHRRFVQRRTPEFSRIVDGKMKLRYNKVINTKLLTGIVSALPGRSREPSQESGRAGAQCGGARALGVPAPLRHARAERQRDSAEIRHRAVHDVQVARARRPVGFLFLRGAVAGSPTRPATGNG